MSEDKQKTPNSGDFYSSKKGEAQKGEIKEQISPIAKCNLESPTGTKELMEEVCEQVNLMKALKRVKANKGCPGVDGMKVEELGQYLKDNWSKIKEQLLTGKYKPQPVRRVAIPKPGGGQRELGIPTALDRFIQQAMMQVLQGIYEKTFSENSYGFRPNRSAHQAVKKAQEYINEGYTYVVDMDIEKFFDRVNHDRLMSELAKRIEDKRMLRIIRAYLNAGVMEDGLVKPTEEGMPQGGNLSPLLSNIVLDELDKELEKRGHRYVRYADDCNVYVRSRRAGERVIGSLTRFINKRLKLRVNKEKSAVDKPSKRKILGYSFTNERKARRRISPKSIKRFKDRVRGITGRRRGISLLQMVRELMEYARGWMGYYCYCQTPSVIRELDSWIRRRIRSFIWKKWKTYRNRVAELMRKGVNRELAYRTANASRNRSIWSVSTDKSVQIALPNVYIESLGMTSLMRFVKV